MNRARIGLAALALAAASAARAATFETFTLYWENDTFASTDRDYTNGVKATWSTPLVVDESSGHLPGWSRRLIDLLPFVGDATIRRAVSVSVGQNMYTPADITRSDLLPDDRPYAGHTYVAAGFHSSDGRHRTTWEFDLGVIGPASLARETQDLVHRTIGVPRAQGWSHQLGNEPTLEAVCESSWRMLHGQLAGGLDYDVVPHLGARVGTVQVYANAGAELRVGWNVPRDFGSCPIRPGCETRSADAESGLGDRIGIHAFAAADGRAVARDAFLDGNLLRASHHVDKLPFVADLMTGVTLAWRSVQLSYSYVLRTRQFRTQRSEQIFGAVNLSMAY